MAKIQYPVSQVLNAICSNVTGRTFSKASYCENVPPNDVLQFANVTSIHDACAAVVKLL